jgi:hypothetical protein
MLLIDFEGGDETLAGLEIDVVSVRSWEDYNEVFEPLVNEEDWTLPGSSLKEGELYKSIGIDSISETHIFALLAILEAVGDRRRDPDAIEIQDYGKAGLQMRRLLREFRDLKKHVFYIATAKEEDERGVGRVRKPALSGQMSDEVVALMSVVGYLAQTEDEEKGLVRLLILQNYPQFRTKIRTKWKVQAPDEIEDPTVGKLLDVLDIPAPSENGSSKAKTKGKK